MLKVISGGQRGVDIAALRAAKACGIATGGWMPKGWVTQDGPRESYGLGWDDGGYDMQECEVDGYPERTYRNVRDSDMTIRIASNFKSPGEICTLNAIKRMGEGYRSLDIPVDWKGTILGGVDEFQFVELLANELASGGESGEGVEILNVAGNARVGLEEPITDLLKMIFSRWRARKKWYVYHEGTDNIIVVRDEELQYWIEGLKSGVTELVSRKRYEEWAARRNS